MSESDPHTSVGGAEAGAPDGVFGPVGDSDPHTSVGGAGAGAPDGAYEPVSASDPHTSVGGEVGFVPAADDLPTVDGVQTEVPFGSDMQLNPQPIPPGIDLHPPGPIAPADAEVSLNPQPIPPGIGADIGEPVTEAAASAGPDVAATSIIIVGGLEAAVGADLGGSADAVSLNPQPIPPGMGADIGEPVADAAASAGPDVADSSIIIVGGTEAPVFNDVATASAEAPVVADVEVADTAMEDVASTVAMDDGPLFDAAEEMHAPIEEQVFADDGLDG